jgi:hypothetical protein
MGDEIRSRLSHRAKRKKPGRAISGISTKGSSRSTAKSAISGARARRSRPGSRNTRAAKRLLERLLHNQGSPPKRMITEKFDSYAAARRKIIPKVNIASTKSSTIVPKILTFPFESERGRCRAFDHGEDFKDSRKPSPWSAISSFHPAQALCPRHPPAPPLGDGRVKFRHAPDRLEPSGTGLLRPAPVNVTSSPRVHSTP